MSLDEQLSGALHDAAGELPDDAGSWRDVQSRGQRTRRRRAGRAGLAVVTVLALGAGVFAATRADDDAAPVITTPRVGGELLARVEQDGASRLVALSAVDGRVLREFSSDPRLAFFGGVSAASTGDAAYLTIGVPDPPTELCSSDIQTAPVVGRVDLRDGTVTQVMAENAAGPLVSPDGALLAYGTSSSCAAQNRAAPTLGLLDLRTGVASVPFADDPTRATQPLAWSPGGDRLLVRSSENNGRDQYLALLDPRIGPTSLHRFEQPEGFEAATFLPDGRLVIAYRIGPEYGDGVHHVAVVDGQGQIGEELFQVTNEAVLNACCGAGIVADPAGRIALLFEDGAYRPTSGGHVMVWAPGDEEPRTIVPAAPPRALEVAGVAWLPHRLR